MWIGWLAGCRPPTRLSGLRWCALLRAWLSAWLCTWGIVWRCWNGSICGSACRCLGTPRYSCNIHMDSIEWHLLCPHTDCRRVGFWYAFGLCTQRRRQCHRRSLMTFARCAVRQSEGVSVSPARDREIKVFSEPMDLLNHSFRCWLFI